MLRGALVNILTIYKMAHDNKASICGPFSQRPLDCRTTPQMLLASLADNKNSSKLCFVLFCLKKEHASCALCCKMAVDIRNVSSLLSTQIHVGGIHLIP